MDIRITSTAFADGQPIPQRFTCQGTDVSPPLAWTGVPANTKNLALICDDPDAPSGDWVHWVLYGLPPATTDLAEKVAPTPQLPGGARQGSNDFQRIGYGGPCPPIGRHRYFHKLYALDTTLGDRGRLSKADVLAAMKDHVIRQAELVGTYERKRK